jgi:vacuolar protein sorting-associated protein 45
MISSSAVNFGSSVFNPPAGVPSAAPGVNLQLGNISVNVGGSAGTGVYRTSTEGSLVQTEGIRDGVRNFMGKVKLPGM